MQSNCKAARRVFFLSSPSIYISFLRLRLSYIRLYFRQFAVLFDFAEIFMLSFFSVLNETKSTRDRGKFHFNFLFAHGLISRGLLLATNQR